MNMKTMHLRIPSPVLSVPSNVDRNQLELCMTGQALVGWSVGIVLGGKG